MGDTVEQEMASVSRRVQESIAKHMDDISATLMDREPFTKASRKYQEQLGKMGLMMMKPLDQTIYSTHKDNKNNTQFDYDGRKAQKIADEIMSIFVKAGKEVTDGSAESFKKLVESNEKAKILFQTDSKGFITGTKEEWETIYAIISEYEVELDEIIKKNNTRHAQNIKKMEKYNSEVLRLISEQDELAKKESQPAGEDDVLKNDKTKRQVYLNNMKMLVNQYDVEVALYNKRMEMVKGYWEAYIAAANGESEADERRMEKQVWMQGEEMGLQEQRQKILQKMGKITDTEVTRLVNKYQDMAESVGEAIGTMAASAYNSIDDRKAAAKSLLVELNKQITKELHTWLTRVWVARKYSKEQKLAEQKGREDAEKQITTKKVVKMKKEDDPYGGISHKELMSGVEKIKKAEEDFLLNSTEENERKVLEIRKKYSASWQKMNSKFYAKRSDDSERWAKVDQKMQELSLDKAESTSAEKLNIAQNEQLAKDSINTLEVTGKETTQTLETAAAEEGAVNRVSTAVKETQTNLELDKIEGSGKEIAKNGLAGVAKSVAISAAISILTGMISSAISKWFPSASSSSSSSSSKKLATGMLTYAEGRYTVDGNDGHTYAAQYEPTLQTGVYDGGNGKAHMALFSEVMPEMVISGPTTRNIQQNYPELMDAIMTIEKHGSLRRAIPTYAEGTVANFSPVLGRSYESDEDAAQSQAQFFANMQRMSAASEALLERLSQPITAELNMYGKNGAKEKLIKADKFYSKNKL
jgi:hypothetical protein